MSNERSAAAEVALRSLGKGWTLAAPKLGADAAPPPRSADAAMPSLADLQAKYGKAESEPTAAAPGDDAVRAVAPADEEPVVVAVESGGLRKVVGVQGEKVVWRQG